MSNNRILIDNYQRVSFEELPTVLPYLKHKRIAPNLDDERAILMANLYECLLDAEHKLPKRRYTIFDMKEDIGVKKFQIGTPGGGFYGPYRCFRVKVNKEEQIAGIGMNRYKKVRTLLCVVLKKKDTKPHHALQLSIDDYMKIDKKNCIFTHKGNIGLGTLGSGKNQVLLEKYVEPFYPKIIDGNHYFLGKLHSNILWHLNDRSVVKFVENLISYSIVRDMYRDDAKREAALNS